MSLGDDYEKVLFEDSEEFKRLLDQLPEPERTKTLEALKEFARDFYSKCIQPLQQKP